MKPCFPAVPTADFSRDPDTRVGHTHSGGAKGHIKDNEFDKRRSPSRGYRLRRLPEYVNDPAAYGPFQMNKLEFASSRRRQSGTKFALTR
jgi:hypothetical protein